MGCYFPQEILDLVIDCIKDDQTTLKTCCLVSKALVQRAQKHLFVKVKLHSFGYPISRWRETFPDPTNSPAHHTQTLSFVGATPIAATDADIILAFRNVANLTVNTRTVSDQNLSFAPLRGAFPAIRSLNLTFGILPDSEIFGLICSFPLLEDLAFMARCVFTDDVWSHPPTSPRLTGCLELYQYPGLWSIAHQLLDLPNGLHFRRIAVSLFFDRDVEATMDLVSGCQSTLESLSITNHFTRPSLTPLIDLSNYPKIQALEFRCSRADIQWVTTILRNVRPENIHQISIGLSYRAFPHLPCQSCSDLDSCLVRCWTSHSLRVKFMHGPVNELEGTRERIALLFPQITRRVVVEVVEYPDIQRDILRSSV
ncbi:hypothetical protein BJ322DRAFT_283979 [Thelephora terrestris]|uniref:Uncharacterized protein n=1 Tax=Thelephora terrestris TaxID=56493 RepID=A0A9P6H7B2_9AGAM|nr:hypothetical protein BJ322DRAFT_283979 [Thelephora terrestris]